MVSAAHTGIITLTKHVGGATLVAIESGVLQVRRPFYNVSADATGGSSRDFYEKVFIKNTNATNNLLAAVIAETDPGSNIAFALEDAVNDNNSVASRLDTAPTGMQEAFSNADKNVSGTDLAATAAIGVWLKLTLSAGAAAGVNTYTLTISGSTT